MDFFSGIGGFKIGLERAGFKCVGFCDNDENAVKLYRAFFKTDKELYFDDITKINTKDLPDFDIFCGGFPCQSFSIAGKRRGFEDTRGTMFFELARILKDKRPRYFIVRERIKSKTCFGFFERTHNKDAVLILENVKGLLNHDGGKTFQTILAASVTTQYDDDSAVIGRNKEYARIHQLGNDAGRGKKVKIPARPYLHLTDDDFEEILSECKNYLSDNF